MDQHCACVFLELPDSPLGDSILPMRVDSAKRERLASLCNRSPEEIVCEDAVVGVVM
jgi:hypothetical protein